MEYEKMRKLKVIVAIASIVLLQEASHATAAMMINSTGLANPAETITFDEDVLPFDTVVTTQYANYGVTFSPGLYYDPQAYTATGVSGNSVGNFNVGGGGYLSPVTMNFSSVQSSVLFGSADDGSLFTFTALLNGVPVDSFSAVIPTTGDYFGFEGENFNAIEVALQSNTSGPYFLIDNIELSNAAVPEPASLGLLAFGGAAMLRRRRRSFRRAGFQPVIFADGLNVRVAGPLAGRYGEQAFRLHREDSK